MSLEVTLRLCSGMYEIRDKDGRLLKHTKSNKEAASFLAELKRDHPDMGLRLFLEEAPTDGYA